MKQSLGSKVEFPKARTAEITRFLDRGHLPNSPNNPEQLDKTSVST